MDGGIWWVPDGRVAAVGEGFLENDCQKKG
jgi:hypothetical protein